MKHVTNRFISKEDIIPLNKIIRYRGDSVRLVCFNYRFYHTNGEIKWKKKGEKKNDKNENQIKELMIENLSYDHTGLYQCLINKNVVLEIDLIVKPLFLKQEEEEIKKEIENELNEIKEYLFNLYGLVTILLLLKMVAQILNNLVSQEILNEKNKNSSNNKDYKFIQKYLEINLKGENSIY